MKPAMSLFSAAAAICKRDFLLFTSYRTRMITTFFTTAVSLTLFYYVSRLVHSRAIGSPNDYYAFVVVGLIIFGILTSVLAAPVATLRAELQTGTFERLVVSPFGAVRSIASLLIFPVSPSPAWPSGSICAGRPRHSPYRLPCSERCPSPHSAWRWRPRWCL